MSAHLLPHIHFIKIITVGGKYFPFMEGDECVYPAYDGDKDYDYGHSPNIRFSS